MPNPTTVVFAQSAFAPLAVGFFGLGVGYLIYGPQELLRIPRRSAAVDVSTGIWGILMPGFMQFLVGIYLFAGLAWFHSFTTPALYMAALAFTAYGVHWWAIGLGRALGGDPRPNGLMSIPFTLISVLGIVVFFMAHDAPVAGLFIGLTLVYVFDFFASLFGKTERVGAAVVPLLGTLGERGLGFFHLGVGLWLMYLTWAAALNASVGFKLPL